MSHQRLTDHLPTLDIPEDDGVVTAAAGHSPAVRAEGRVEQVHPFDLELTYKGEGIHIP